MSNSPITLFTNYRLVHKNVFCLNIKLYTKILGFLAVEQRLRYSVMYDVLTYLKPYRSATDILFTHKACLSTCYLSTNYPWISN